MIHAIVRGEVVGKHLRRKSQCHYGVIIAIISDDGDFVFVFPKHAYDGIAFLAQFIVSFQLFLIFRYL